MSKNPIIFDLEKLLESQINSVELTKATIQKLKMAEDTRCMPISEID